MKSQIRFEPTMQIRISGVTPLTTIRGRSEAILFNGKPVILRPRMSGGIVEVCEPNGEALLSIVGTVILTKREGQWNVEGVFSYASGAG